MITVDLDDSDKAALVVLLKQAIAADPFPMSARVKLLRGYHRETPIRASTCQRVYRTKLAIAVEREVPNKVPVTTNPSHRRSGRPCRSLPGWR